ncbi:MAG: amidohydrolase [Variovorax paradoxus]|uniref:Amidohydrolase n=1 Tax=Variovorax paradoxus TaxID=34073 RepID=A0A2W5QBT2_VARPD|nr:MAG: amidohydrolase [Variovorax paradoxus]
MNAFRSLTLAALAACAASSVMGQSAVPSARIVPLVDGMYPQLESIYKDIHANPELGFQETRTAGKLAAELRALGFEVTEGVGRTGVVALYRNGAGPTVMVRTELDALPMEEKTGLPYASKAKAQWNGRETFVAHSCGHDIHMASWVGTARTLLALKDQWQGTLMFIAQPSEETVSGAKAMVDDGLFKRFPKPDYAFALHTSPSPFGFVGYRAGPVTSASDSLEITFKGRGGHGSAPHATIDPIAIGAHFVSDVQTVVSREKDPAEFGVVTIGAFQAGTAGNIIPDAAKLSGTIRSYKPEVRTKLLDGIRRTALASAAMAGAPEPDVRLGADSSTAAVNNNEAVVQRTVASLKAQFGDPKVVQVQPITASEDFSVFTDAGIPSMFFFVGVTDPKDVAESMKKGGKPLAFNHSPYFAPVPEPSIKIGVQAMTTAVLTALGTKG